MLKVKVKVYFVVRKAANCTCRRDCFIRSLFKLTALHNHFTVPKVSSEYVIVVISIAIGELNFKDTKDQFRDLGPM